MRGGYCGPEGSSPSPPRSGTSDRHGRAAFGGQPVAELAAEVGTPAVGHGRTRLAAGVSPSGAQLVEAEPTRDGRRFELLDSRSAVSQLAIGVRAPAVGAFAGRLATGVCHPNRHPGERETARDRSRPHPYRAEAVAELSRRSIAPAPGPIGRGHRAGRLVARADLAERMAARHRRRLRAESFPQAVPELADSIVAPAVRAISRGDTAAVE